MTGFEPRTSGIGSDRSTNWATTTSRGHLFVIWQDVQFFNSFVKVDTCLSVICERTRISIKIFEPVISEMKLGSSTIRQQLSVEKRVWNKN